MNENAAGAPRSVNELCILCKTGTAQQIKAAIEASADINARDKDG